jgi:hypothetical protein
MASSALAGSRLPIVSSTGSLLAFDAVLDQKRLIKFFLFDDPINLSELSRIGDVTRGPILDGNELHQDHDQECDHKQNHWHGGKAAQNETKHDDQPRIFEIEISRRWFSRPNLPLRRFLRGQAKHRSSLRWRGDWSAQLEREPFDAGHQLRV